MELLSLGIRATLYMRWQVLALNFSALAPEANGESIGPV
jgi:hypothetical protein